jgi:hypothetical protein
MAYPVAPGGAAYTGVWIPEIWSTKLNVKFWDASVIPSISNTDFQGDITDKGDKVIIRQIPDITIRDYSKGQNLVYEQPESENVELLIDKGHYWAIRMDDVDKVQADIEWISKFSMDASEQLKIKVDTTVLGSIYADVASTNKGLTAGRKSASLNLGVTGTPLAIDKTNVLDYIVDCGTALDENNIPETGRWIIMPPAMIGTIKKSDIKDASLAGDGTSVLRNGRVGMIDRFEIYSSNLLTSATDGGKTCFNMVFGHNKGLAFAEQIPKGKIERLRAESSFGELVRGLCVYGFKVVYPAALGNLYGYKA